ncbi:MAG: hypothetical protein HYR96_02505 [Deltaproteobacteria bacterium]|nr:hypothetical protein [Deltaproteobacteria bacterium]
MKKLTFLLLLAASWTALGDIVFSDTAAGRFVVVFRKGGVVEVKRCLTLPRGRLARECTGETIDEILWDDWQGRLKGDDEQPTLGEVMVNIEDLEAALEDTDILDPAAAKKELVELRRIQKQLILAKRITKALDSNEAVRFETQESVPYLNQILFLTPTGKQGGLRPNQGCRKHSDRFVSGAGGCMDRSKLITWSSAAPEPLRSLEAVEYCESLIEGGFDDWTLPDHSALTSITVAGVAKTYFKFSVDGHYWSSSVGIDRIKVPTLYNGWLKGERHDSQKSVLSVHLVSGKPHAHQLLYQENIFAQPQYRAPDQTFETPKLSVVCVRDARR